MGNFEKIKFAIENGNADVAFLYLCEISESHSVEELNNLVELMENAFFENNEKAFAKPLFLLCHLLNNKHMARFYLQYSINELSSVDAVKDILREYVSFSPETINGNYHQYNGSFEYEYGGEKKTFSVHSFSNEIGFNLTLLITPYGSIIFDCGAKPTEMISKTDFLQFLSAYKVSVNDVVGVFISHGHLDHYGSIPTLRNAGIPETKFFSDWKTVEIIKKTTSDNNLNWIRPISEFQTPHHSVYSFYNGHIQGSLLFVVGFDNQTVVYTGDYCIHNRKGIKGLDLASLVENPLVARGVDCLITETTHGNGVIEIMPQEYGEMALKTLVEKLLEREYKIFLPAFALGKSYELVSVIGEEQRVATDEFSARINHLYKKIHKEKTIAENVKYISSYGDIESMPGFNNVFVYTHGSVSQNTAFLEYAQNLSHSNRKIAFITTEYSCSNHEMQSVVSSGVSFNVPILLHPSYGEIFMLINRLSPKNIVAIHGMGLVYKNDENKQSAFSLLSMSVQNHWKNTVKTGERVIARGKNLNNSPAFLNAFEILVKSLKRDKNGSKFIKKMQDTESTGSLMAFLKSYLE